QSRPVEQASSRRRVLRRGGATHPTKRRQRDGKLGHRASNVFSLGALVLDTSGGRAGTPQRPGVPVPPGSKTQANRREDSPRNLGGLQPPTSTTRAARGRRTQSPRLPAGASAAGGNERT